MSQMLNRAMVLGLALGMIAIPCGNGQEKPGKAPPTQPGQKTLDQKPAPEAARVAVEIVNRIPPVDKENLKGYWAGVESKTGERWQHSTAAKAAASADAVKITCWIHTDGRVTGLAVEHGSGTAAVDRAARAAITGSVPYEPFPYGIAVDEVKVRFTFGSNAGAPVGVHPEPIH